MKRCARLISICRHGHCEYRTIANKNTIANRKETAAALLLPMLLPLMPMLVPTLPPTLLLSMRPLMLPFAVAIATDMQNEAAATEARDRVTDGDLACFVIARLPFLLANHLISSFPFSTSRTEVG